MGKFSCCCCHTGDDEETTPIAPKDDAEISSPVSNYGTSAEESTEKKKNKSEKDGKDQKKEEKKEWSKQLEFKKLDIVEFDRIFTDFANALDPFVVNREKLEKALTAFKKSVESYCGITWRKTFKEYVQALKDTLKNEGIFIKIKEGAVKFYGEVTKAVKAVQDIVAAVQSILDAGKSLLRMPDTVLSASLRSAQDFEDLDVGEVLNRRLKVGILECSKVVKVKTALSQNAKKLKAAPAMVKDFCIQVKVIISELKKAFGEDEEKEENDEEQANDESNVKGEASEERGGQAGKESKGKEKGEEKEKEKEKGKEKEKEKGKEQEEYHKKLQLATIGIADIDHLFSDLANALNRFILTRERLQQAREAFTKIMKTITEFDGEKEVKAYVKELQKKAKEGKITIYLDTRDGHVKITSIKGVDPPAPYRDAVKALNSMNAAGKESLDLEPTVQRSLGACIRDIKEIDPVRDFKKLVSGMKAVMALPKKISAFNDNRKKVQDAPAIVKEFFSYVKKLLEDVVAVFCEEDEEEDSKKNKDDEKDGKEGAKKTTEKQDDESPKKAGSDEEDDGKASGKEHVRMSGNHGNDAKKETVEV
ncbi:glutamic acid-rich protein [Nematostella vectensis]|uniref:glutamic acid-rich protein n=1 Tax=Nematostella vectensis TaxID=45351 RepID=UPI0020775DAA|nr:glutamic acid-rich protein [Nematostella vectensis]